ncbi:GGDEF domain-containing protein [Hydrocarboniphaga sp.]|uniref:GGDEF domain-containing protein n=1 Tax=Hydrocarboniphaga sp. TaxID=2033016 RepID=UPI003D13374E
MQTGSERRHFESLALTDPLTGLYNRGAFEERAHIAVRQAIRERSPVAVIMVDLDCFKPYNDNYGHAAGDRVLEAVAAALSPHFRRSMDLVARIGGEEFAGLCFGVSLESAQQIGVDLVERVAALNIEHRSSLVATTITASVGVHYAEPRLGQTLALLLQQADAALYAARREGRNRAVVTR